MRHVMIALCLVAAGSAHASNTYRCDDGVVTTTSSTADVIRKCGRPDRTVPLENLYGAGVGERWEYYHGNKTVMFTISGGQVVRIDEA